MTGERLDPDRPVNLYHPVDDTDDHGARGIFGDRAGGFTDPSFLETLPRAARTFGAAMGRTVREKVRRRLGA